MLKSAGTTPKLDIEKIKSDFPILRRKVHGKRLVYLDNAATTQKPKQVIESITKYYENYNSNIHRSVHKLAEEATEAFESSREQVSRFINAASPKEIIFTKNATEALNVACRCISENSLKKGDKIVVTEMEHHSNFVPWQQISKRIGCEFDIVNVDEEGILDEEDFEIKIKNAKVLAFTHMSNVLGTINDAKKLTKTELREGRFVSWMVPNPPPISQLMSKSSVAISLRFLLTRCWDPPEWAAYMEGNIFFWRRLLSFWGEI